GAIRSGRISGFPLDSRYHSSSGPHDRRLVSDLQFGRVDPNFDEVILQDNNLWATAVFKRTETVRQETTCRPC
ncbi:MAG: hypothetical protein DMG17_32030, partial [Acidobacteria bacterium]